MNCFASCIVLGLWVAIVCAQDIKFGDDAGRSADHSSVDVQPHSADGKAANGEVNPRFFPGLFTGVSAIGGGLLGGIAGGLLGSKLENKFDGGHGIHGGFNRPFLGGGPGLYGGHGYPGGFGGIKPGRCAIGGLGGFGGGLGGFGGGLGGFGGPFGGFRSASSASGSDAGETKDIPADSDAVTFTRRRRSNDDSVVVSAPGDNVNTRTFGGLFGIPCQSDYTCPGYQKCCFSGFKATCRPPVFY